MTRYQLAGTDSITLPAMIVDTHIHLYTEKFNDDRDELITEARESGVGYFLMPNIDMESLEPMMELTEKYYGICLPMMGLHPCDVKEDHRSLLGEIRKELLAHRDRVIAIGETGLDHYWDKTFIKEQEEAFNTQLDWCLEFDLPVVIHSRETTDLIISILENRKDKGLSGVFHCFTGTAEQAERITALGFYMGIGGVVTFKNGGLDKVLPSLPENRIILETDAPYLSPAPYRGKVNKPAYIRIIAEKVASVLGKSMDEVEKLTTENASRLFKTTFN